MDYQQQALDFLTNTNTTMDIEFKENRPYFEGDKEPRDVYEITLTRGEDTYTFEFGNSINNTRIGEARHLGLLNQI